MAAIKSTGGEAIELSSKVSSIADNPALKNRTPPPKEPRKRKLPKVEEYFFGPRDVTRHSKIPLFFKIHGSVLPKILLPLCMVTIWATINVKVIEALDLNNKHKLDSILLTVLGFLVGFALSFRNSTAYQRYDEGRRAWANLGTTITNLARMIWVNCREREGDEGKADLLAKITCLNMLAAFPVALKHRVKFEPYIDYDDMRGYIDYLDTYARDANVGVSTLPKPVPKLKKLGQILDLPIAIDNPRSEIKNATRPLGNLPLEMLIYLQSFMDCIIDSKQLPAPIFQMQSINLLGQMNEIMSTMDRIVNTPLPLAYSITINQIAWAYILLLPIQIFPKLKTMTIPATLLAAYVILGLMQIGIEIENPFGDMVSDLPLDSYCQQIQQDVDIIMSKPAPKPEQFMRQVDNMPLYPLYMSGYQDWAGRSKEEIREALRMKMTARGGSQRRANGTDPGAHV